MSGINSVIPSCGLIIVDSTITSVTTQGRGRRARTITNTYKQTSFGSGFVVDGDISISLPILQNKPTSSKPMVVSVAHVILTVGTSRYFIKLFDENTKLPKIYEINLISYNRSIDICIFEFKDNSKVVNQACLTWKRDWDTNPVLSGDRCYVVGFPLGDSQLSIVEGSVRDPTYCFGDLGMAIDQIYHSAPVTNGNSGSCILDKDNKIIGIHAWGQYQYSNLVGYENFSGGPGGKWLHDIIFHMIFNRPVSSSSNTYSPRTVLGIHARIVDDLFKIKNFDNIYVQDLEGIIVENIIQNNTSKQYSIDTHNKKTGTTKIQPGDVITHIYVDNTPIAIGYTKEAPVSLLFYHAPGSSIKLRIKKAIKIPDDGSNRLPYWSDPEDVTLDTTFSCNISDDNFYSRLI
jgi:hypothetical protein